MTLPAEVGRGVEAALSSRLGREVRITGTSSVGGGCISPAARVTSDAGVSAFVKWGMPGGGAAAMFAEEARSLEALARAGVVRVPEVLGVSGDAGLDRRPAVEREPGASPWLALEWLEPGRAGADGWHRLGGALARLHRGQADRFGWPTDNFIGSLVQRNGWMTAWPEFWRDRRLAPQLRLAVDAGHFDARVRGRFDRLLGAAEALLAEGTAEGPSLVHGDLWGGNAHALADGCVALIDPASYHGHREADLAMTELFGGFGPDFYRGYDQEWPLDAAYARVRRPIYQLYYLLVHVNLFGASYVGGTVAALDRVQL